MSLEDISTDENKYPSVASGGRAITPYARTKAMAKEIGCNVRDVLVLSMNNDPFYSGSRANRERAQWFKDLWQKFGYTTGVHLRRVHYQIVAHGDITRHDGTPYRNTDSDWNYLCDAAKHARILGLVNAGDFVDRRNPDAICNMSGDLPARQYDITVPWGWCNLPEISADFHYEIERPRVEVFGYEYTQGMQPYHLELWIEKSTMNDVIAPICERHCVNLVTGSGFMSITAAVELIERANRIGKPVRILYVSDHDPAGAIMPRAVSRQLEFWNERLGADIKVMPIALTAEQVREYDLPRTPIKKSDLRAGNFEAVHGKGAVELDALEALCPGELARIVEEHIKRFRDPSLEDRTWKVYTSAHDVVEDAIEEDIGPELEQIQRIEENVRSILDSYRSRVRELNALLQQDLEPYRETLESLHLVVTDRLAALHVDLPDLPAPREGDESGDWLFDSQRTYMDQLRHYKSHAAGGAMEVDL